MGDNMNSSGGESKYSPGRSSSLSGLGVEGWVADGTTGTRPDASHEKYGGAGRHAGKFQKDNKSAAPTSPENNSGSGEKNSSGNGIYVKGTEVGGVGARQNMTLPGKSGGPSGKLLGGDKIPASSTSSFLKGLPEQKKGDMIGGTEGASQKKSMGKAKKELGVRGGPKE